MGFSLMQLQPGGVTVPVLSWLSVLAVVKWRSIKSKVIRGIVPSRQLGTWENVKCYFRET